MKSKISILFILLIIFSNIIYAKDIIYSSKVIIDTSDILDGSLIKYQGEAIGEVLYRNDGEYGWVNINDGINAIGVWMDKEQFQKISLFGAYNVKGDNVLVTGIMNKACVEHGGDLDIHAVDTDIIEKGQATLDKVDSNMYILYRLLSIPTVLLLMIVFFIERNKEKKKNND